MRNIIKSIMSLSIVLLAAIQCYGKCKKDISGSQYIKRIDESQLWNGLTAVQLYMIKNHEYIVVRAGTSDGGVHIIHAESCPCKQK